jgi:glutathione S-transferase
LADTLTFYYAPRSRSSAVRVLLEELQAPYELHVLNMRAGEQRQAAYMAVNPMGKVPALWHRGHLTTELAACFIYLADLFPKAGLAPKLDEPLRGPYLRWLVFYNSSFEVAIGDKAMGNKPPPPGQCAYGDFDTMFGTLTAQLAKGPYMLGDRFTAADVLWGASLRWMTMFKLIPERPEIARFVSLVCGRPSFAKIDAAEHALDAEHEKLAKALGIG